MNKNVLIIGTGNVGSAVAADLSLKGYTVGMLRTSIFCDVENFNKINISKKIKLVENDVEREANISFITDDVNEAFSFNPSYVFLAVQTKYHANVIDLIADFITENMIVIFTPGYLATCYCLEKFKRYYAMVEAESSPIDCRLIEPGVVNVLFRNVRNPIGVFPSIKKNDVLNYLSEFKFSYIGLNSVVEAALHNPNLIVHTVGAIMSIPRIEYSGGKYSMYREVFTPSIYNLVDALDNEKMNVLEKLGLPKENYFDACKFRNSLDLNVNSREVFVDYATNSAPDGPSISNSRYITEDVQEGLVLLESLGKELGVRTDITTSLINLSEACLNEKFRYNGRNVNRLGSSNIKKILDESIENEK